MIEYPNELNIIFDKLDYLGIKAIIIGGYNRDFLLKNSSKDIDIELYGLDSYDALEKILQEFGSVNSVGKSFGVCKLIFNDLDLDFSFPRMDSKIDSGHTGFIVTTDSHLDFKIATSRRDFTVNAIGYDVIEKKILDPFNGREDLENKILRAVDLIKFDEDPLRVLRAVHFASRYNFKIDEALFHKCKSMIQSGVLNELPSERIYEEIKKTLLNAPKPSKGLLLLKELDGFLYFNEFSTLTEEEFIHILDALDTFSSFTLQDSKINITLMLSIVCYYFSEAQRVSFLKKLSSEKKLFELSSKFIISAKSITLTRITNYDIYSLATKVNISELSLLLMALYKNDYIGEITSFKQRAKKLNVLTKKLEPLLHGKDLLALGLKPSKEFSTVLYRAYEAQMLEKFTTHSDATQWLKEELLFS